MTDPQVTFVVPCHNGRAYLEECFQALAAQRVPCEAVLVDDGSTDGSREEACRYAVSASIPIYVVAQKNAGPAAARNVGLRTARAPLVCFLDVDDRPLPDFAAEMLPHFEQNPAVVAIYSQIELTNSHRPVADWQKEAIENSIPSNLVVRTEIARKVGGFPVHPAFRGRAAGEDVIFREQLEVYGKIARLNLPLLRHTIRPGSHFDYFMDRCTLVDGKIVFNEHSKEELDGSLDAARAEYRAAVRRRAADHALERFAREGAAGARFFQLATAFDVVAGFLHPIEGFTLYWLAAHWPVDGATVEIGSFKGRSTCWLAAGCQERGRGKVTAVDHFTGSPEHQPGGTHADPDIARAGSTFGVFRQNLQRFQLQDWVVPRVGRSEDAILGWNERIRLLFIDGDHSYQATRKDFELWSPSVGRFGLVAFHDVNVSPGVTQFYNELIAQRGEWRPVGMSHSVGLVQRVG
jgi:glycosyltransferase involved in cell wall biosynthesis